MFVVAGLLRLQASFVEGLGAGSYGESMASWIMVSQLAWPRAAVRGGTGEPCRPTLHGEVRLAVSLSLVLNIYEECLKTFFFNLICPLKSPSLIPL